VNDVTTQCRNALQHAQRIVVKLGTNVLVDKNGLPNQRRIARIVTDIMALKKAGREVLVVSSGAIAVGMQVLGMKRKPRNLADLQMAASVGQTHLLEFYRRYFSKAHCHISQVLLTYDDLKHRTRHLNARNALLNLITHDIVPIINENDVVAVDEIKVGDNDILSALITVLVDADVLILLTTPDGLRAPAAGGKTQRVKHLETVDQAALRLVHNKQNMLSTGGMATKLQAAQLANKAGAMAVIASGFQANALPRILQGADVGTLVGAGRAAGVVNKRKHWVAFFHRVEGALRVDRGAADALIARGKSLLPIGVKRVSGKFSVGSLVNIEDHKGVILGRGLVEYSSEQIAQIKGKSSVDINKILGEKYPDVVIHRDNMVIDYESS